MNILPDYEWAFALLDVVWMVRIEAVWDIKNIHVFSQ